MRSAMGLAVFSVRNRQELDRLRRAPEPVSDPVHFLELARRLGAGGIQTSLAGLGGERAAELRRRADAAGMWIEGSESLPRRREDLERFDAALRAVKAAGAVLFRTVLLGGRRYETFDGPPAWERFRAEARAWLELAAPLLEKHGITCAFENHKDFRTAELLPFLKSLGCPRLAVCVDFANNFTLLEDNAEVVEALAPVAAAAHVKDMAVAEVPEGFLAADVRLGAGLHDLPRMLKPLAKPGLRLCLEMSTRDPLRVPLFTPGYWATLKDVPASDLARTLRTLRERGVPREKLPAVDALPLEERVRLEEEAIAACFAYAAEKLGI